MKSKLDEHRNSIIEMLDAGVSKTRVAKDLGVNPGSLHVWLKTRGVLGISESHPLFQDSVRIIHLAVSGMRDKLYAVCSHEIEQLEHDGSWIGNGHNATQRIVERVTKVSEGPLANAIRREILR